MQFKLLALAAAVSGVVLARPQVGGDDSFTPETVVESIKVVTKISDDTNTLFTSLSPVNLITSVPVSLPPPRGPIRSC